MGVSGGIYQRNYTSCRLDEAILFKIKNDNIETKLFGGTQDCINVYIDESPLFSQTNIDADFICEEFELSTKIHVVKGFAEINAIFTCRLSIQL